MNNKAQKMKKASINARKQNKKQVIKNILLFPVRVLGAIWNWLKSIDVVGMINLTLLVAIIVLFSSLISDFICCKKCDKKASAAKKSEIVMTQKQPALDKSRILKRKFSTVLPVKPVKISKDTSIRPQIRTIGVKKPEIIRELSLPANELPKQTLSGDVIVDVNPSSPILSNGVKVNGNLYIQNMRKYTIPCDAKISGHLFIRNVNKVKFCGKFTVNGNIYVNRESSFGPLPEGAMVNGQIIL